MAKLERQRARDERRAAGDDDDDEEEPQVDEEDGECIFDTHASLTLRRDFVISAVLRR